MSAPADSSGMGVVGWAASAADQDFVPAVALPVQKIFRFLGHSAASRLGRVVGETMRIWAPESARMKAISSALRKRLIAV